MEKEQYVVLEVNGIPAFATPDQEEFGLDFNNTKIEKIVDMIERKVTVKKLLDTPATITEPEHVTQ